MSDKPPHDAAAAAAPRVGKRSGFRTLVGYHATVWRENYAEIELDLEERHYNSLGIAHGGVLMAMIDAAMGHAATWTPVPGNVRYCVTISMNTTFLESPRTGLVKATAKLISVHDRIGVCESEVRGADGALLAVAQGSYRYFEGSDKPEGVPKKKREG